MPRHGRKTDNKLSKADMSDVTMYDFADSTRNSATRQLKKNCINKVVKEVKNLNLCNHDITWEKALDYVDCVTKYNGGKQHSVVKKSSNRRRRKTVHKDKPDDTVGVIYPLEIWFLISQFVRPEDVGRFAGICRGSLNVVSSSSFWHKIYKRFYRKVDDLPEILQPEYMVRSYGLRALVIRALYFMYPPFINKLKCHGNFDEDLHILTKRLCVLSWSQKNKNQWLFYFKLKQSSGVKYGRGDGENEPKPTLLDMLEDITANDDEKCKVLQVTCLDYTPLPMVTSQTLSGISLILSDNLSYYRLRLNFCSGQSSYMGTNLIVLNSVVRLRVLDWWHPSFPHSDSPISILSSRKDGIPFEEHEF